MSGIDAGFSRPFKATYCSHHVLLSEFCATCDLECAPNEPERAVKPNHIITTKPILTNPELAHYHTLYKALQLRCSNVAEKLRAVANTCYSGEQDFFNGLADTLDTPISLAESANILHLDRSEAK